MQTLSFNQAVPVKREVSLRYLFLKFFKIGLVSFGGYMALVAMIQREFIEKDNVIEPDSITDGISIASLLPGPVAVNMVTYIGYTTKGKWGALVAVLGVLLPASVAMLVLSWLYFGYAYKAHWNQVLFFTPGAVSGIILATGMQLHKKEVKRNVLKNVLCIIAIVLIIFIKSYLITVGLIIIGGLIGYVLKLNAPTAVEQQKLKSHIGLKVKITGFILALIELSYILNLNRFFQNIYLKIWLVFSGISLSLFGGGYVMIPIMQSLLVNNLKWVSSQEFLDCIAFSQLTPGPILVSSVFIGFKLAGLSGAVVALAATFAPTAILMVMVAKVFKAHKEHQWLKNAMAGIKPIVVGMVLASAFKLLQSVPFNWSIFAVCAASVLLSTRFKINPVYIILTSLAAGISIIFFQHHI